MGLENTEAAMGFLNLAARKWEETNNLDEVEKLFPDTQGWHQCFLDFFNWRNKTNEEKISFLESRRDREVRGVHP